MSENRPAEFHQFRFVRQEAGALAELPRTGRNERLFLVVDCRRYRLARLHIFEGRAKRDTDAPALFRREFEALSQLHHPALSPLISFGRDDSELFYADAVVDGEPLREYLRRAGPMPAAAALRALLDLIGVLQIEPEGTHTLSNFSSKNLFVKASGKDTLSLVFSDFSGWDGERIEDEDEKELGKVDRAAVALYSMLAGQIFDSAPAVPFTGEARNLSEPVKSLLKPVFVRQEGSPPFKNLQDFTEAVAGALCDLNEEESPLPPRRFFRDWLIEGLPEDFDLGSDFKPLSKTKKKGSSLFGDGFILDAATAKGLTYRKLRFHLFPNQASIPRTSWMDQHRYALRVHGRPLPNQAPVEAMLCGERFCLIGEGGIDGVSMPAIVEEMGPLSFDHAREIGAKLMAALDSMEAIAGSCPIWWLPPENLFAITGSERPGSIRQALEKNGIDTWKRTALRLRLHQTGESLLAGVDLPGSLVDLLHTGSKDYADARRSAVLLPILWFLVTGGRLNWKKPLPWHDGIPVEIYNILEESRRHLVDSPKKERGRLLDRISLALRARNLELEPFTAKRGPLAPGTPDSRLDVPSSRAEDSPAAFVTEGSQCQETQPSLCADASAEDTHWVTRVGAMPGPAGARTSPGNVKAESEAEDPVVPRGNGFAERLIFPNASPLPGGERAEKPVAKGRAGRKRSPKTVPSSAVKIRDNRSRSQSLIPAMLFLAIASVLCGIVWGSVAVYKRFAFTINQQVLSETLALVQYTPVTTSVSEFAIPRLGHSPGGSRSAPTASPSAGLPLELPQVAEASTFEDAIARGDRARSSGQFAAAVAWYLRAQEIDFASPRPKETIAETIEAWASGDSPGIPSQLVADLVEKTAFFARDASRLLADFYLERDREEGLRWLQRSAEAGDPRHQVILGLIFARGQIVPRELNIATRWFQRAANKGDVDGQFHFGECLILGEGINRDAPRGIDFLERAASAGDARALELLGICHAKGDGVNPDGRRAKEYFEQAIARGSVSAYYNLAVRFAKGHGAEKDEGLAARTFLQGAEKGSIPCMYAFGRCLETGFGIETSFDKAKDWLTKAAHLGDIEAQAWCASNEVPFDKPAELLSGF